MESTGEKDRIQCSQATADLLRMQGKSRWLCPRENKVNAKGKGQLQTYWIEMTPRANSRRHSNSSEDSGSAHPDCSMLWGEQEDMKKDDPLDSGTFERSRHQRLVDYNVDLLSQHLKHIVARRQMLQASGRRCSMGGRPPELHKFSTDTVLDDKMVLDEVTEVIRLPCFNASAFKGTVDPESIQLPPNVVGQLKRFVSIIAAMYRPNPFHNFEHASHVTMSVSHAVTLNCVVISHDRR